MSFGWSLFLYPLFHRIATAICKKRRAMLLTPVAALANLVDYRYRGAHLESEDRSAALKDMAKLIAQLDGAAVHAPPVDDLLDFIGEKGAYKDSAGFQCHPFNFWAAVYPSQSFFLQMQILGVNFMNGF